MYTLYIYEWIKTKVVYNTLWHNSESDMTIIKLTVPTQKFPLLSRAYYRIPFHVHLCIPQFDETVSRKVEVDLAFCGFNYQGETCLPEE